jgi:hypothetical protein
MILAALAGDRHGTISMTCATIGCLFGDQVGVRGTLIGGLFNTASSRVPNNNGQALSDLLGIAISILSFSANDQQSIGPAS